MNDIRCPLREAAEISGRRPALVREGLHLTYADYDGLVSSVAAALYAEGCREGARVALFLQQDWTYPVLLLAIIRLGAVACPVDTRWPRETARAALATIGCTHLVGVIAEGVPRKEMWGLTVLDQHALFEAGERAGNQELGPRMPLDRPATILFTSGSSGAPKAVLHSYGNHYYSAVGSNTNIRVGSGDRWLLSLPLYHVSGLGILFRCILGGATVVLPSQQVSLLEAVEEMEATHVSVVQSQLRGLLEEGPRVKRSSLRVLLAGGGPIPAEMVQAARALEIAVFTTYGSTETASQVTTTSAATPPGARDSSGCALRYREVRVSAQGEVAVRGKTLFQGYVTADGLVSPVDKEGWFATGDLGVLDEQGYLRITGRRDNLFISGGENIHPEEVEAVLLAAPGVEAVVVTSVADAELGQRMVAFVKCTGGKALDEAVLLASLDGTLPRFKWPKAFFEWPGEEDGAAPAKVDRARFKRWAEELAGR